MNDPALQPPPELPLSGDLSLWALWDVWFSLVASAVPYVQTFNLTINPASVPANSTSAQAFTLTGVTTEDRVVVNKPSHTSGIVIANAYVSAADQITIVFANVTAGAVDPPSETYRVFSVRR